MNKGVWKVGRGHSIPDLMVKVMSLLNVCPLVEDIEPGFPNGSYHLQEPTK